MVSRIDVSGQSYIPFEIKLPAHTQKVNAVAITNTAFLAGTDSLGTICLQSQDMSDTFLMMELYNDFGAYTDCPASDVNMENFQTYDEGYKLSFLSIDVPGDTSIINGWLKLNYTTETYSVRVYFQYELAEQITEE